MDEKQVYCQACLSNNRKLYSLLSVQRLILPLNFLEFNISNGGICWECMSIMKKFRKFIHQVASAQSRLKHEQIQNLKSLSTLSTATNITFQYEFHYNNDPLTHAETTKQTEIKQEVQYDDNYSDDKEYFDILDQKVNIANENINLRTNLEETAINLNISTTDVKETRIKLKKRRKLKRYKIQPNKSLESTEELEKKFCKIIFTEEQMLMNREEKRNQPNYKKIPYKCDWCVLGFTRKDTYDLHMEKKHDEKVGPNTCPVCQSRFPSPQSVERHKLKHYVSYRCRLCKYETLELWSALSHCRIKHDGDSWERIHCPYCDVIAKTPEELSVHITSEHSLYCSECGEKFKGPNTLRSHKRRIHGVKREFICDLCSKTFKTKSRLESHMVGHNATIAQNLAYCALCKVQYKNIYVYRSHLKTSANHADQAYQCRECNKKFASKVYWKKHYNFYHLRKSQHQCELCNKLFISDWRLKNHKQTQHGLSRSRDHRCNVCGKKFFTLSTLKGHELTHSEHRSFMCEDCGDTFKQRPALYTHYKLVHKGVKRQKKV